MLLTRLNYRPKPKHANHVRVNYNLGRDYRSSIMKGACTFIPGTLISLSGHLWRGKNPSSILIVDTTPNKEPRNHASLPAVSPDTGESYGTTRATAAHSPIHA